MNMKRSTDQSGLCEDMPSAELLGDANQNMRHLLDIHCGK